MTNQYKYWTTITAFCYERKCKCENCSESYLCAKRPINNIYGMKPIKFAALQTFANIGLYGYQEALDNIGQEKNSMKDIEL